VIVIFSLEECLSLFLLKEKELPKDRDAGTKVQGQPDRSARLSGLTRGKSQGIINKERCGQTLHLSFRLNFAFIAAS
jgi:hypothetical protein